MTVKTVVKTSEYHDSVTLMLVARELLGMDGVNDSAVVMATEPNKAILEEAGLLTEMAKAATPNDMVIAVDAVDDSVAAEAMVFADEILNKKAVAEDTQDFKPKSIKGAVASYPEANVCVISVAGRYAADEAWEALMKGLHVLLFSDNVSLEDEIALKKYATEHGLLLMGPGAGTTILNQVALGFANAVPKGPVGIVSAAGTGLQEVSTLIAKFGSGITQGIGTGGRDLKKEVGGMMMMASLKALQEDDDTKVIALVSKPSAPEVLEKILTQIAKGSKPVVVCVMGGDMSSVAGVKNAIPARTLQEGGMLAAKAAGADVGDIETIIAEETKALEKKALEMKKALKPSQKYLRGLFSGGTLCYEAQVIWREMLDEAVYSNAPLPGDPSLEDSMHSFKHTTIDLGEEEFTVGRPHPMIDNDLRLRRILHEAADPEVAVILMDVVIGYGAHLDPAAEIAPTVVTAKKKAKEEGRDFFVVASVTGTEGDPQGLSKTRAALERAGVIVLDSNAAAARLTAMLVR